MEKARPYLMKEDTICSFKMRRLLAILSFLILALTVHAQEEMRVIDSLEDAIRHQEGRERVLTMIELSYAFFDFSFDDCIDWGEKAIKHSLEMDDTELEADANYALGINYGYHTDLDLAQVYLKNAFDLYQQSGNEAKAFESIWNQAYFEMVLGNMDTAYIAFEKVMKMEQAVTSLFEPFWDNVGKNSFNHSTNIHSHSYRFLCFSDCLY